MNKVNALIWAIYIALLLVLLPHTAWLFNQFEPLSSLGLASAWAGAFAFEAAIAALTHKLARHLEGTPKRLHRLSRFSYQYLNAYSIGLVIAVMVSALANLAHAVEFGRGLAIFATWGISPQVYQASFGAVLPVVSLLFARVLSNVSETEDAPNPEAEKAKADAEKAKADVQELRRQLRDSEAQRRLTEEERRRAEQERDAADQRFAAAGDLFARLFSESKAERILAAADQWPQLPASALAKMVDVSPSYVSEVLKSRQIVEVDA